MIAKSRVATSPDNPSNLPPRFEIRQLTSEHIEWATALIAHTNFFHSPVWTVLYPDDQAKRVLTSRGPARYLVEHQISSGLSFGVFDTEYKFKRAESAATGGALYWDEIADQPEASSTELLERMDFPLASIALAYDGINAIDMGQMAELLTVLPLFGALYGVLEQQDPRDADAWRPKAAGEVLMRNATSTRADYEGRHLMAGLARFLMREAKLRGFRGIQIECAHDAVNHVWSQPPAPFKGEIVTKVDMATYEHEGKRIFAPATQVCTKVFVTL